MRNVSILGSTGSIGTQALSVIRDHKDICVKALCCGSNIKMMETQAREFKPKLVCVNTKEDADSLKIMLSDMDIEVSYGMEGLIKAATLPEVDVVLTAIVGMIGILPTISAIREKKDIALANKETLCCAGSIIMPLAKEYNVKILPVDSEHSAIFQSLEGRHENEIKKIILTASGGPFFGKTYEELKNVSVADALNHPNWSMGKKISIDSATLMNKGLEIIEACHLFSVKPEKIEVVIHRESILHSAVLYNDGAIIGQMGKTDMRVPISYALYYPKRMPLRDSEISLFDVGNMTYYKPDYDTFKGLSLCIDAINKGGNMPAIVNAANEVAVKRFLDQKISFLQIYEDIQYVKEKIIFKEKPTLQDIIDIYNEAKEILM